MNSSLMERTLQWGWKVPVPLIALTALAGDLGSVLSTHVATHPTCIQFQRPSGLFRLLNAGSIQISKHTSA